MNWIDFAWGFGAGAVTAVVAIVGYTLHSIEGMFSKGN